MNMNVMTDKTQNGEEISLSTSSIETILTKVFTTNYSGKPVAWAIFSHGTVMVTPENDEKKAMAEEDVRKIAINVMKKDGPVAIGSSSGDFDSVQLTQFFGEACEEWMVIFTSFSGPQGTMLAGVTKTNLRNPMTVGMTLRAARNMDAKDMKIEVVGGTMVAKQSARGLLTNANSEA